MWSTYLLNGGIALAVLAVIAVVTLIVFGKYPSLLKQGFQNSPPDTPTFTMFYADWCGHCKKAKPAFEEFAADGQKMVGDKTVVVKMINADSGDSKLESLGVKGYPTFMLEMPTGEVVEYKGKRDVPGYLEFLNQQLGVKAE